MHSRIYLAGFLMAVLFCFSLQGELNNLPIKMQAIMRQPKYLYANWGVLAKNTDTGETLLDYHSNQLVLPASTTKLFSVAALLRAYGDDYRFQTPVFAAGSIQNGILTGSLVLVAQGDLTMGGRQPNADTIAFTSLDHTIANQIPGAILTPQDPLDGLNELARQISKKGIKQIDGDVLIDDRLFEAVDKREMMIAPIMINENLIDIVLNPTEIGQEALLSWRPAVPGYAVINEVKTVSKDESLSIEISADQEGRKILVKGSLPVGQQDIVRTFPIKDPAAFARLAFIQALQGQGIAVHLEEKKGSDLPPSKSFLGRQPLAVWTSPPLSEYAKLILKVSHNMGADLVPLLLAVRKGQRTFDEGMLELGKFVKEEVKLAPGTFVFVDAAGGDSNRLTPQAEVQLLAYVKKWPKKQFQSFYRALPILGVDGSLAGRAQHTPAAGNVRAKTGTGVSYNLATQEFFLTAQTLAGYAEGKNGHLIEFMISVNNGQLPTIADILPIFEDLGQLAAIIYDLSQ